jgi:hypothetical protein
MPRLNWQISQENLEVASRQAIHDAPKICGTNDFTMTMRSVCGPRLNVLAAGDETLN